MDRADKRCGSVLRYMACALPNACQNPAIAAVSSLAACGPQLKKALYPVAGACLRILLTVSVASPAGMITRREHDFL
jgi:hypothetical protein